MSTDLKLKMNNTMMVVGPSNCGKTVFVCSLIKNKQLHFDKPIKRVVWCYGEMKPKMKNVTFVRGIPNVDAIKEGDLVILDDLAFDSNNDKDITALFTKISHNRRIFTIFITQNMFHTGGQNRTRSLNTHYFVLFRNPRDAMQVKYLARQMDRPHLIDVFEDVTKNKPYSYVLVDLTTSSDDDYRIRTGVLKGEQLRVYIAKA